MSNANPAPGSGKPDNGPLDPNLNPNSPTDRAFLLRSRNWSEKLRAEEFAPASHQNDPAARESHRQSEAFNAQAHRALQDIPVPAGLRDRILAQQKIVQVPYWRTPRAIALAAALAFMATGLTFWITAPREDHTYAGFRSRMVGFAIRQYDMDLHTNQLAAVQSYLAEKGAPSNFTLPTTLAATAVKGGKSLSWQGKPVGMVCFGLGNETLYMFVVEAPIPGNPTNSTSPPQLAPFKGLATATWSSGDKTFLLAGEVPLEELERLVKS